jgi:hypothetical protein
MIGSIEASGSNKGSAAKLIPAYHRHRIDCVALQIGLLNPDRSFSYYDSCYAGNCLGPAQRSRSFKYCEATAVSVCISTRSTCSSSPCYRVKS